MALGKRKSGHDELWIASTDLPKSPGHPFYGALNRLLKEVDFDRRIEALCAPHYATTGRPSIPPGVYFRMMFVGYFEGIDSQRGIAWRCQDSLSLREFLGLSPTDRTPDHSSLTVIRQRLPLSAYQEVFTLVLAAAEQKGLLSGRLLGVDSTLIEANAAMKTIVRKDTKDDWKAYVKGLAAKEGVEIEDDDDLRKFDKGRKDKSVSNRDWESPSDPDAKIMKMKDGRTHLSYKVEHAVDLEGELVLSATVHPADRGDAETLPQSTLEAQRNVAEAGSAALIAAIAADKGYHKAETLAEIVAFGLGIRTYVCVPSKPVRRRWSGKPAEWKEATQSNKRRMRSKANRRLQRWRSERVERTFAHACGTGGARRSWIRGLGEVAKRYTAHVAALNLGVILRKLFGVGSPRGLAGLRTAIFALCALLRLAWTRTIRNASGIDRGDFAADAPRTSGEPSLCAA
jgi:transposase